MLSRDLVHVCDHDLPTREEKRENKVKRKKQNMKQQNVKNTVQKEALFFPLLTTLVSSFKLLKTREITHKIFNLSEADSLRSSVAV